MKKNAIYKSCLTKNRKVMYYTPVDYFEDELVTCMLGTLGFMLWPIMRITSKVQKKLARLIALLMQLKEPNTRRSIFKGQQRCNSIDFCTFFFWVKGKVVRKNASRMYLATYLSFQRNFVIDEYHKMAALEPFSCSVFFCGTH